MMPLLLLSESQKGEDRLVRSLDGGLSRVRARDAAMSGERERARDEERKERERERKRKSFDERKRE